MQSTIDRKAAVRACGAGILAAIAMASSPVGAQGPSAAQASAIRQACGADYGANCAGVPTGGSAALACLQRNAVKTSTACQQALQAVAGSANSAAPAESAAAGTASNAPARDVAPTPVPSGAQPPEDAWPHTVTVRTARQPSISRRSFHGPGSRRSTRERCIGILPDGREGADLGSIDVAFTTATDLAAAHGDADRTQARRVALSDARHRACRAGRGAHPGGARRHGRQACPARHSCHQPAQAGGEAARGRARQFAAAHLRQYAAREPCRVRWRARARAGRRNLAVVRREYQLGRVQRHGDEVRGTCSTTAAG